MEGDYAEWLRAEQLGPAAPNRRSFERMCNSASTTVVAHEMEADRWYEQPTPDESSLMLYPSEAGVSPAHRNGNGHSPKVTAAAG